MKCPKCSNEIPKGVNFCANCGEPIQAELLEKKQDGTEVFKLPDGRVINRVIAHAVT